MSDQLAITDVFLLISASNERQVGAIVDGIEASLRAYEVKPARREGDRELRWVLLDFLDLVVHVQHTQERSYYALERLWRDCPQLALNITPRPEASDPGEDRADVEDGLRRTDRSGNDG